MDCICSYLYSMHLPFAYLATAIGNARTSFKIGFACGIYNRVGIKDVPHNCLCSTSLAYSSPNTLHLHFGIIMSATASTSTASLDIATPSPVMTHTTRTVSESRMRDPLDDFFGYTMYTSPTHDSRHDERRQSLADVPPPYAEESAVPLPEYSLHAPEPVTLAMYLFKFGFCKFRFWCTFFFFTDMTPSP